MKMGGVSAWVGVQLMAMPYDAFVLASPSEIGNEGHVQESRVLEMPPAPQVRQCMCLYTAV